MSVYDNYKYRKRWSSCRPDHFFFFLSSYLLPAFPFVVLEVGLPTQGRGVTNGPARPFRLKSSASKPCWLLCLDEEPGDAHHIIFRPCFRYVPTGGGGFFSFRGYIDRPLGLTKRFLYQ